MRSETVPEGAKEALILFNPLDEPHAHAAFPEPPRWVMLVDTASASIGEACRAEREYPLAAKSVVVLVPANQDWVGDQPPG